MSDRHVVVSEYADLDRAPDVSDRERQRVATIFTEQSWEYVVWVPEWLLDEKDIEAVESSDHLAVGDVGDYSEKAWSFGQPHRNQPRTQYLPKSQVVVFERARGVETVATPQAGLAAFAGGGDGD